MLTHRRDDRAFDR